MTDLLLSDDGDLPLNPKLESGPKIVAQRIETALSLFHGEWRLDGRVGLPWLRWLQEAPPPIDEINVGTRLVVLDVLGVSSIRTWDTTFENQTVKISGEVVTETAIIDVGADVGRTENLFSPLFSTNIKRRLS